MKPALQHRVLIAAFLGMVLAVPFVQIAAELRAGIRPRVLDVFTRAPTPANLRAFEATLEESNVAGRRVREIVQYVLFSWLRDGGEKVLIGRDRWLFYQPGVSAITQRPTRSEALAGDAAAAVVDFRDQLATRGIKLIVVVAPNKESVYPDSLSRGAIPPTRISSPDTRAFFERCSVHGVDVVDLFEIYRAARTNRDAKLYMKTDTHWSPDGIAIAARAVANRIGPRQPSEMIIKPELIGHEGDLVKMLQNRAIAWEMDTESMVCRRVLLADATPYRDDPTSDVLVLGDSFCRIFDDDPRWRSGFIPHLARELGRPLTSIVMDGGGATLVRQELARRPQLLAGKKFVVWEFSERDLRLAQEGWQKVPLPMAGGGERGLNAMEF